VADFDPASDPDVIALFAAEAEDRVLRLAACLDSVADGDRPALDTCRREAHTLKGTAAMMGFASVAESARRIEAFLGRDDVPPDVDAVRTELTELARLVATATTPGAPPAD
jgi:chemotaxis protein histidine kinase CheA